MLGEQSPENTGIVSSIIFFVITIAAAVILLMASAVIWIGELIDSGALACLIVATGLLLIAWLIYFLAARRSIERLNRHLERVYAIATAANNGYRMALKLFDSLFGERVQPKAEK